MTEEFPNPEHRVRGSILDMLGMNQEKMTALAMGVAGTTIAQIEPVLVAWVQEHTGPMVQSMLDSVEPALVGWVNDNVAPAVQSLLDTVKATFPPPQ